MKKKKAPSPIPQYHHGDLRRAITAAALEMIAERGVENLSLREVARKIGVTTAAPYHHFRDRQSLLMELSIEGYKQLLACLQQARDRAKESAAVLRATVNAYLHFGRTHPAQYEVMFSGEFANHPRMGEMLTIADDCLKIVRTSIAGMTHLKDKQTADTAFCAWSLLHGILMLDRNHVLQEHEEEQDRLAMEGVFGVVRGIYRTESKL